MEEQPSFSGSLLNVNELAGVPMSVPLFGVSSTTSVEYSSMPSAGLVVQVEKPRAALDEPTRVVPITKGTSAKSFAQVLSKTTVIPHCQFPKASLKGDDFAIKIPENEYKSNLESCKNHLHGRLILSKGDPPLKLQELRDKLNILWKPLSKRGLVSLGRGFYEFVFSDVEDVQRVRAALSWSLKPGFLKLFAWTPDFNSNNHK